MADSPSHDKLTVPFTAPLDRICIDTTYLERCCPLDNHLVLPVHDNVRQPRSNLASLPVELLHAIWSHLDLATLTAVRGTSRPLRASVTSQRQYTDLVRHAAQLLRATLSSNAGGPSAGTLEQAHALVFRDPRCQGRAGCARFGLLVHLPTGVRVCVDCLRSEARFFTPRVADVRRLFLVDLAGVPVVTAIPGRYGAGAIHVDRHKAVNLALLNEVRARRGEHALRRDWVGNYGSPSAAAQDAEAFMFAVRVPFVDLVSGQERLPLLCKGCFRLEPPIKGPSCVATFTKDTYAAHVESCRETESSVRRMRLGKPIDDVDFTQRFWAKFGPL